MQTKCPHCGWIGNGPFPARFRTTMKCPGCEKRFVMRPHETPPIPQPVSAARLQRKPDVTSVAGAAFEAFAALGFLLGICFLIGGGINLEGYSATAMSSIRGAVYLAAGFIIIGMSFLLMALGGLCGKLETVIWRLNTLVRAATPE